MLTCSVSARIPDTWRIKGEETSWPPSQVFGYTKTHTAGVYERIRRILTEITRSLLLIKKTRGGFIH